MTERFSTSCAFVWMFIFLSFVSLVKIILCKHFLILFVFFVKSPLVCFSWRVLWACVCAVHKSRCNLPRRFSRFTCKYKITWPVKKNKCDFVQYLKYHSDKRTQVKHVHVAFSQTGLLQRRLHRRLKSQSEGEIDAFPHTTHTHTHTHTTHSNLPPHPPPSKLHLAPAKPPIPHSATSQCLLPHISNYVDLKHPRSPL